jgi:hypothetical protein
MKWMKVIHHMTDRIKKELPHLAGVQLTEVKKLKMHQIRFGQSISEVLFFGKSSEDFACFCQVIIT